MGNPNIGWQSNGCGLPTLTFHAQKYKLSKTIYFNSGQQVTVDKPKSMGFSAASTNNQSFWAGIENITSTSATLYTYVTAGYITLLFKNIPPPASGKVREYVVEVDGHYIVQNRFASAQNRIRTNQNLANSSKNVLQNKLINNYPNPFNPTTKISFEIGNSSNVTLKIFNVLGKEVATLVNDLKNSGHYEVMFDGSNFVSGIYFYKIAGNFHQIKQMVLIK